MNEYAFEDLGDGKFGLAGELTFATAEQILRESEDLFAEYTHIEVDLSAVTRADSAGLALLLEWITWANHNVREIRFVGIPERINAIAHTTEVDHLLKRGERWAGFIQAPSRESDAESDQADSG